MIKNAPLVAYKIAENAFTIMNKHFAFDIKDRLIIRPEVDMYRIGEDEGIWKQATNAKFTFHVFFDGEFVCFFDSTENPPIVEVRMLKELARLKKEGKIHWNKFLYQLDKQREEEKIKKEKADEAATMEDRLKKATTSEEKIVHLGIQKALKKRKKNGK